MFSLTPDIWRLLRPERNPFGESKRFKESLARNLKAASRPPSPLNPQNPCSSLRPWQRAVLEVILQNAGGEGGIHLSAWLDGADDFSAADHFGSGQA